VRSTTQKDLSLIMGGDGPKDSVKRD